MTHPLLIVPIVDALALLAQRLRDDDRRVAFMASAEIHRLYGALRAAMPLLEASSKTPEGMKLYRRAMATLMRTEAKVG